MHNPYQDDLQFGQQPPPPEPKKRGWLGPLLAFLVLLAGGVAVWFFVLGGQVPGNDTPAPIVTETPQWKWEQKSP